MPDKNLDRKQKFELARTMRIQQLAKSWGVPTQNIYTNVNWGYDDGVNVPNTATYFTFDEAGKVNRQKIDYGPVLGYPAGVYSPKPIEQPVDAIQQQKIIPPDVLSAVQQLRTPTPAGTMKKGGRIKKAQDGDILPLRRPINISTALENVPVNPLQTHDPRIKAFFEQQRASGMVPVDASLNGPDPYSPQFLLDPATGKVSQDPDYTPLASSALETKPKGGAGFNMDFNAGALITGVNTAINQLYDRSRGLKEFNRLKRAQLQGPGYNANQYGTGSQAIFKKGGRIRALSDNQYSEPILQFDGPSHDQGGIPISYGGKRAEVEGAETAYIDQDGDLNIFGNLQVPGTGIKFKTAAKKIAAAEATAGRKMDKAISLVSDADPTDHFDRLRFNAGNLSAIGAGAQQQALSLLKERLSALQEQALINNGESLTGAKAANGLSINQGPGPRRPSLADRHNNPGNIKYSSWSRKHGATKGEQSSDKDYFARFESKQQGLQAMKALLQTPGYANRTVNDAITRWTGGGGYKLPLGELDGKKVKELSPDQLKSMMNLITQGEDSKLYDLDYLFTPQPKRPTVDASIRPPVMPLGNTPGTYTNMPPIATPPSRGTTPPPSLPPIRVPENPRTPYRNPLRFSQIAPEILALGDRPDFVPGQRYEPNLYQPYQVTFQDRLNENQATFNRIAMQAGNNPSALSVLAGQKYMADSGVLAEEFRSNQGITADITNKNIALLNDAQLKNLGLADTQFVRQEQAKANTRQNIYNAINSVAAKIDQNRLETRSYNAVSSLYPQYTFDRQGMLQYVPNNGQYFGDAPAGHGDNDAFYQRSRLEYDRTGSLHKTVVNTPSEAEQAKLDYQIWNNQLKQKTGGFDQIKRRLGL